MPISLPVLSTEPVLRKVAVDEKYDIRPSSTAVDRWYKVNWRAVGELS